MARTNSNTAMSDQGTTVTESHECLGSPATPDPDEAIDPHSMEIFTMRDLFTDPATIQWMETATTEETELDMSSTTVSDEISPDHYLDVDDDMLGEFLWDALDCH